MNKDKHSQLYIPENLDNDVKSLYIEMMESIRESSKRARGAILNERGQILWEEPLAEYEQRMKGLKEGVGSCTVNINNDDYSGEVNPFVKELIEIGNSLNKSSVVRVGASREEVREVVDSAFARKKPSPPPPPPMRKYKTGFFGLGEKLVNQDEIDAHRELMDKWREENLK